MTRAIPLVPEQFVIFALGPSIPVDESHQYQSSTLIPVDGVLVFIHYEHNVLEGDPCSISFPNQSNEEYMPSCNHDNVPLHAMAELPSSALS